MRQDLGTHGIGLTIDGRVQQCERITVAPALVLGSKVAHSEMSRDGRDGKGDVAGVRWHAVREVVVLDPRDCTSIALGPMLSTNTASIERLLTVFS